MPEATIRVNPVILQKLNRLLSGDAKDPIKDGEILHTETADFGEGIEADIKVVQGDGEAGPYVDAVLFDHGEQICVLEPEFEQFNGIYSFYPDPDVNICDRDGYTVRVILTEPLTPEEFVENQGKKCPDCGSHDLDTGHIHREGNKTLLSMFCLTCDAEWYFEFALSGYKRKS